MTPNPPSKRLAEIGRSVAARLGRNPHVQSVSGTGLDLFVIQQFLSTAECEGLIAMIEAARFPSELLSDGYDEGKFRTSDSANLVRAEPLVSAIDARICGFMGLKPRMGETMQGQRYDVDQHFMAHHDFFHTDRPYWAELRKRGGQRSWTAMIYLNEPGGGGETWFPDAGLKVSPRTAMLLAWNNMARDGSPNPMSLHEGCAVTSGVKYIVTKWFREMYWA